MSGISKRFLKVMGSFLEETTLLFLPSFSVGVSY